jgi:hypothetical protein
MVEIVFQNILFIGVVFDTDVMDLLEPADLELFYDGEAVADQELVHVLP